MTDAEVISASLEAPQAFEAIFDRHFRPIRRYLRRRLSRPVADELAAEVFTAAFAHRRSYDLTRPDALPWLYGIAANLLRRHVRDEDRELAAYARSVIGPATMPGSEPLEQIVRRDLESALAEALRQLEPGDREALLLFAWANLSYEEIAAALELPIGTVRSRLNRARTQVRRSLAPQIEATREVVNE